MDFSNWDKGMTSAGDPLTGAEKLARGGRLVSIDGDAVVMPPDPDPPRPGLTWTAFSDAMPEPHRKLLVTNNLAARDSHGRMLYVWLVDGLCVFRGGVTGEGQEPLAFSVHDLTHWRYALPEEG